MAVGVIDDLALLGADALGNHFTIILPTTISYLTGVYDQLSMRITGLNIPDRTINTYEITKRGRKIDRPNGIIEQERNITFNFRPDKRLLTYKAISNWMNYIQNNETALMASDSGTNGDGGASLFRADLEIWSIDDLTSAVGTPNSIWTLLGAYPTSLGGLDFSEESGEPFDVAVTLNCRNIVYPV